MAIWGPGVPKYGREGRPIRRRTVSSVKKSCDALWAKAVKSRAGWKCERCGDAATGKALHAHHVFGRSDHRLRFDLRNGCSLCWSDHRWAEEHPLEFADWFRSVRYEDADYLAVERQKGLMKRNLQDYLALEMELQKERQNAESSEPGPPAA